MAANEKMPSVDDGNLSTANVSLVAVDELASTSVLLSSSENSNNENREKELQQNETAEDMPRSQSPAIIPNEQSRNEAASERLQDTKPPETVDKAANESPEMETKDNCPSNVTEDEYSKYVSYNKLGIAIYTDPITKSQYEFDADKAEWIAVKDENRITVAEHSNSATENPYENEHYRWCHKTSQWLPKTVAENEFYKWDTEKGEWIPKAGTDSVSSTIVDGVYQYTDSDGATFFWDDEKNAWFPKIDDDFMAQYQMNYGFVDNTSSDVEKLPDSEGKNDTDTVTETEKGKRKAADPRKCCVGAERNWNRFVFNFVFFLFFRRMV